MALGSSWTNIASGSFSSGGATLYYYIDAKLNSQNIATNRSSISTRARTVFSGNYMGGSGYSFSCTGCSTVSGSSVYWYSDATVLTGSVTVTHNADGTGSLSMNGACTNSYLGMNISISGSIALPTIPRASKPTFSTDPLTIGSTQTITTNRASASFTHTLTITVGGYTTTLTEVGASTTWTPSTADLMPYMTSYQMTASVECITYSGTTAIGTKTSTFTLQVDTSTYKPVINSVSLSDSNGITSAIETNGTFINGHSDLQANISLKVNTSDYSSALASATVTLGSKSTTYTLSGVQSLIAFTASDIDSDSLVISVTDSRGYTVTQTTTLTVIPYENIEITSVKTERVNSGGVASETGEYISYEIKCNVFDGSFGQAYNSIVVSTKSKAASAQSYDPSVLEQTVTTSGAGEVNELTITGITVGTYSPSSQFDIIFTLEDRLSNDSFAAIRIHEGVPVYAWGEDHFDVYGELHIHDRSDVTKYSVFDPTGYPWNLVGTASGSNAVAISQTNYSELMLVAKYVENANYTWVASSTIPLAELSADSIYLMMPARISTTTGYDKGCVVKVSTTSANIFEFISDRANISGMTLSVYYR